MGDEEWPDWGANAKRNYRRFNTKTRRQRRSNEIIYQTFVNFVLKKNPTGRRNLLLAPESRREDNDDGVELEAARDHVSGEDPLGEHRQVAVVLYGTDGA